MAVWESASQGKNECKCVRVCVCDKALACPSIMQQASGTRSGRPSVSVGALASSRQTFPPRLPHPEVGGPPHPPLRLAAVMRPHITWP